MEICGVIAQVSVGQSLSDWLAHSEISVRFCAFDELCSGSKCKNFDAIIAPAQFVLEPDKLQVLSMRAPVIVIDESPTLEKAVASIRNGAHDYLPTSPEDQLATRILGSVRNYHKAYQEMELQHEIVGHCDEIAELRHLIQKVAPTHGPVLIYGATGTGKNLVAKCIHSSSARAHRPFVTMNCDRVPPELVLSELFGDPSDEHGRGRVATANTGTLFLNEIGSLPMDAQARLLHLLEAGEIQDYSTNTTIPVETRVLAASHIPLEDLAIQGKFRDDLRIRLSQFIVTLPLLAERGDDIELLAQSMLVRHKETLGKTSLRLHPECVTLIRSYEWPGNVRELDQAIERAVLLCESDTILPGHLGIDTGSPTSSESDPDISEYTSLDDYFIEFVRTNEDRYTETELADKLGISRKSLWERRNKFGIPRRKTKIKRLHS